jgi:hypothetical protein
MRLLRISSDSLGVFASGACLVHCLALPLVASLIPIFLTRSSDTASAGVLATRETPSAELGKCQDPCCDRHVRNGETTATSGETACSSGCCDFWFHLGLLAAVVPLGLVALISGQRKHGKWRILLLGLTGMLLMTVALLWGHQWMNGRAERWLTVSGSVAMVSAHLLNHRCGASCRHRHCRGHDHLAGEGIA